MAPKGRNTVTCRFLLFLSFAIVAGSSLLLYLFHEELVRTIRSYTHSTCNCSGSQYEAQIAEGGQAEMATTYKDLSTLEELPATNVLWVNNTANDQPEAWGISMFHSFHCLKMWKESLDPETAMKSHVNSDSEYAEHSNHCISYLLQAISCFADGTIEPPEEIVQCGKHGRRIHGMGYTHQCRDQSLLWKMDGAVVEPWDWQQGDTVQTVFGG